MKAYKVINQNGLLFSCENGKRIILKEQCEYLITAEDSAFEEKDSLNIEASVIRDKVEMLNFVKSKYKHSEIRKVFDKGQLFVFRVGLGKTKDGDEGHEYFFLCRIKEDLYAYRKVENSFLRLCQCHCVVEDCISKNLRYFEPVFADSLNQVASNTIAHYFALKRATSLNVLIEFKILNDVRDIKSNFYPDFIKSLPALEKAIESIFKQ